MNGQSDHVSGDARSPLREYLTILWLRKWSVLLVAILVLGGALLYSFRQVELYQSTVRILMQGTSTSSTVPGAAGGGGGGSTLPLQTEGEILRSSDVAEDVAADLDLPPDARALQSGLSVEIQPESSVMVVNYVSPRALEAQQRARAFADAYLEHRQEGLRLERAKQQEGLSKQIAGLQKRLDRLQNEFAGLALDDPEREALQAQINTTVGQIGALQTQLGAISAQPPPTVGAILEPATLPSAPTSPNHMRTGAAAAVVGLFLGIAVAFMRERLDDRLRGRMDLERFLGAPVLAIVPHLSSWRRRTDTPLVTATEPRSGVSEAYRTLRTSLLFAAGQRGAKTLLITSAHAGEGKTATAANLGVSLAQAGKRVILLSADLRKPRLHRFFDGRVEEMGLTSILSGEIKPWEGVADVGHENLRLVPSGPVPGNPAELLGSDAMGQLLAQFREIADLVIIDSAPVLVVADALAVAPFVDAVLFVADAERTKRGAVVHAREQLEQVDAPVIGAVLNNFDPTKGRKASYYYYGYYYSHYQYDEGGGRLRRRRGRREPAVLGFERPPQAPAREDLHERAVWSGPAPVEAAPPVAAPVEAAPRVAAPVEAARPVAAPVEAAPPVAAPQPPSAPIQRQPAPEPPPAPIQPEQAPAPVAQTEPAVGAQPPPSPPTPAEPEPVAPTAAQPEPAPPPSEEPAGAAEPWPPAWVQPSAPTMAQPQLSPEPTAQPEPIAQPEPTAQ
ncbi:MAG TPA: polysaccharide biosynthesis tyrosine autokinase, partial [Actinomycetota bacterium]|nr:polysaccharide biosynthesis tyrosine autokinase [Actinomycetota bacterium]